MPRMDKDEIVEALINNSAFDEDDRDYLEGLSTSKLRALATNAKVGSADSIDPDGDDNGDTLEDGAGQVKPKKMGSKSGATKNKGTPAPADDDETEDDDYKPKGKGKGNAMEKNSSGQSLEDFKAELGLQGVNTRQFRDVVTNGLRQLGKAKKQLITRITANGANVFTKQQLLGKDMEELEAIAALCPPTRNQGTDLNAIVANYAGLGDVEDFTVNGTEENDETGPQMLDLPILNFSERGKGATALADNAE